MGLVTCEAGYHVLRHTSIPYLPGQWSVQMLEFVWRSTVCHLPYQVTCSHKLSANSDGKGLSAGVLRSVGEFSACAGAAGPLMMGDGIRTPKLTLGMACMASCGHTLPPSASIQYRPQQPQRL